MPHLDVKILRAYRMTDAKHPTRIHYIVTRAGGQERHLYCDPGDALYDVLDEHLLAQNYVFPASASA